MDDPYRVIGLATVLVASMCVTWFVLISFVKWHLKAREWMFEWIKRRVGELKGLFK